MGVKFVIPNIVYRQSFRLNSSLIQLTSIASVPSREVIYQQFPSFLDSVITQVYVWTALIRDSFHTFIHYAKHSSNIVIYRAFLGPSSGKESHGPAPSICVRDKRQLVLIQSKGNHAFTKAFLYCLQAACAETGFVEEAFFRVKVRWR